MDTYTYANSDYLQRTRIRQLHLPSSIVNGYITAAVLSYLQLDLIFAGALFKTGQIAEPRTAIA